jgi:2-amino-4-hydroxy-6-hydroxymethyldihydropteridine diphosphokinase
VDLAVIGVGSNVDARTHVPAALARLLRRHGSLHVGTVVETAPVGMTDGSGAFLNCAVAVPTALGDAALQAALHGMEAEAGRDRSAPGGSWTARPLDLDLLLRVVDGRPAGPLPDEPWMRPLVAELLHHLGAGPPAPVPGGVALDVLGHTIGRSATSLAFAPESP